jgi:hypothetical protein
MHHRLIEHKLMIFFIIYFLALRLKTSIMFIHWFILNFLVLFWHKNIEDFVLFDCSLLILFPFNGSRRFARNIINHPANTL